MLLCVGLPGRLGFCSAHFSVTSLSRKQEDFDFMSHFAQISKLPESLRLSLPSFSIVFPCSKRLAKIRLCNKDWMTQDLTSEHLSGSHGQSVVTENHCEVTQRLEILPRSDISG